MNASDTSVTIIICTRQRPVELERCLASIPVTLGAQILVADDSADEVSRQLVEARFPHVTWIPGPRSGLGANRNAAVRRAVGRFVLFLDDDAALGPMFLERALQVAEEDDRTIVTGRELNNGHLVAALKTNFLGHQKLDYADDERMSTIVINATLFPRSMFASALFDDTLIYGYDEVDICARALEAGYRIKACNEAINFHYPSVKGRDYYRGQTEISRIYVRYKIYRWIDEDVAKAWTFFIVASIHFFAFTLKNRGLRSLPSAWKDWLEIFRRVRNSKPQRDLNPGLS